MVNLDRARGCAVGAAIGDALGMPLEFGPCRPLDRLVREMTPGRLPAGTFTDDTEMALALAESLLARSPLDPADLAQRFVAWLRAGPPDVGLHTRAVLARIAAGESWDRAVEAVQRQKPDAAGNGSVMRCWPAALAHWADLEQLLIDSRLQSQVTHPHPECVAGSAFVNAAIYHLLRGMAPTDAVAQALDAAAVPASLRAVIEAAPGRAREELVNSGWVRHTLESVVWGLLTTKSFEEAVVQVVNLGNDADTAGAVVGALAGAAYGRAGIPARWGETLRGEWPLGSRQVWQAGELATWADRLTNYPADDSAGGPGQCRRAVLEQTGTNRHWGEQDAAAATPVEGIGGQAMRQINAMQIETRWGYKTFELYRGDITRLDPGVDLLAVSVLAGDYYPLRNTVIGALHENFGINLTALLQDCEFDLRSAFNCWISKEIPNPVFKRLLCVEMLDPDSSIDEVIQNMFVALSILEAKGILVQEFASPLVGTGALAIDPVAVIKPLLNYSLEYLHRSASLKRIRFVTRGEQHAAQLDAAMNNVLGRVRVMLPHGEFAEAVRHQILDSIERTVALDQGQNARLFTDMRRVIANPESRSFELGIIARKWVEFLTDDILGDPQPAPLFVKLGKIEKLSTPNIAQWMISYMHMVRIFGNEGAHEKDTEHRIPAALDETDLKICLLCMCRLLDFWLASQETPS